MTETYKEENIINEVEHLRDIDIHMILELKRIKRDSSEDDEETTESLMDDDSDEEEEAHEIYDDNGGYK
jgi:hypothetical protein